MRGFSQVLAGIMGVVFVITAVIALLIVNATHVLTNREVVKEALGLEAILREVLPELVNTTIAGQVAVQDMPLPDFDTDAITEMVLNTMPEGWLDNVVDSAVDGTFDYLLTENEETAVVVIDLNPMLNQLQGEPGRQLVLQYLEALPVCTPLQMLNLLSGEIPTCLPIGVPLDQLSRQVHGAVAPMLLSQVSVGEGGVVRVPLATIFSSNPQMMETVQRIRFFYQLASQVWVFWLLPLLCLILILVLTVRSLWQWGIWWGWPLATAGFVGLLFSLLIPGMVLGWLRTAVFTTASSTPIDQLWQPLLQQGLINLSESWAGRMGWQAGILLVLGFLFLLFGFLAKKFNQSA
jgi:hypothetical protein